MSKIFPDNLLRLRENAGQSQLETSRALGLSRSTYANYEAGANLPKLDILLKILKHFGVTLEYLLSDNSTRGNLLSEKTPDDFECPLEYDSQKPTTVTKVGSHINKNMLYVSTKAQLDYVTKFAEPEYLQNLPAYRLPGFDNATFRIFQIKGQAMFNTLTHGDRVITRWAGPSEIIDGRIYVLLTRDGVLISRCLNRLKEGVIIAKSDNNFRGEYPNIVIEATDIIECWTVVERLTKHLPEPGEVYQRLHNLEVDVTHLKSKLK